MANQTASDSPSLNVSNDQLEKAAAGDRAFAANLYRTLRGGRSGNLFFSPASIRIALTMAYAGAGPGSETATQMAHALALGDKADDGSIHPTFAAALRDWNARNDAFPMSADLTDAQKREAERKHETLRVVNRLWGQTGHAFQPAFLDLLKAQYAAPLETLDFAHAPDAGRVSINRWVDQQTEHKINELLPNGAITPLTKLVLTNAVYFKANWDKPFEASATTTESFATPSKPVPTKFMQQTSSFRYAEANDAKVLEMPYASGDMSMMIVLPNAKDGLDKLERSLDEGSIERWSTALAAARVHVIFPRFTTSASLSLNAALSEMGMPAAFDLKKADFSGMDGTHDLSISSVVHQAYVAVDEKGTEAAAATGVVMVARSVMLQPPREFRADHPFLFIIRDTKHGNVLFMGRLSDPTA